MRYTYYIALLTFSIFSLGCLGTTGAGDSLLFGTAFQSNDNSCTSEIEVSSTNITLLEDGDVERVYNASAPPYFTDTDGNGGISWGFYSVETCVFPTMEFTGTIEVPVTQGATNADRVETVEYSYPPAINGDPLGTTITFNDADGYGRSARKCFKLIRVDDGIRNTNSAPFTISLDRITSADDSGLYASKDPCDISVALEDDEAPGIRVSNISQIMEEPEGSPPHSGTFQVELRTQPTADVVIPINMTFDSVNAGNREGTADKSTLTFTNANWDTPQVVTVYSQDDFEVDDLKTYTIQMQPATSTDSEYNGIDPRDVEVYNRDASVPGYAYTIVHSGTSDNTNAGGGTINGFATDEMANMGSNYATFQISLRSRPSANVTLNFSTNDTSISTVLTPTLTFTPDNYNVAQTVQVTGKPDGADNGNKDYTISFTTTTTDNTYDTTVTPPTFRVRSCDNDNNRLIALCNFSGSRFGTSGNRFTSQEPSGSNSIWLISKNNPGGTATVNLTVNEPDADEGDAPASVTIDSSNYNVMSSAGTNRIALSHGDDFDLDGTQNWDVTTATSTGAISYDPENVFAQTTDDEQLFYISKSGNTSEDGTATAKIYVCLGATPASAVTISASCSGDECQSVTADTSTSLNTKISAANPISNSDCNGSEPNRVEFTVTGADDSFADGSQNFNVTFSVSSGDGNFNGQNPGNQSFSNADDESPGKRIFIATGSYNGEMTAQGVQGADDICANNRPAYVPNATYKALIVSNSGGEVNDRIPGGADWVLTSGNYYYRCIGSGYSNCSDEHQRLFIANGSSLIPDPTSMVSGRGFSNTGGEEYWTGMTSSMSVATQSSTPAQGSNPGECNDSTVYRHNCGGFTLTSCPTTTAGMNPVFYGETWENSGTGITSNTNVSCATTKKIICVQQ